VVRLTAACTVCVIALGLCASACAFRSSTAGTPPKPALQTNLDTLFSSPTGLYSMRYNHTWQVSKVFTAAGDLDLFTLPQATIAVEAEKVQAGTTLDGVVDQMLSQYRTANIQGLQRVGSIDVGGGRGELVHALTYVNAQGLTVASAPSPGARPRNLYQAFYVAGPLQFTFSVAWQQGDSTDYLPLFRSILHTFTLAGAT
jgi:hypothetical protein